ncbi:MAG: gamma-glutamyl-gamma-aminobutyrate hydrolase family protein [Bacteroidales bacterium]
MAKKVLIVARRESRKNKLIQWVSEIYFDILIRNGVYPVVIPVTQHTLANINFYLDDYDGLMMVEGGDINPRLYGVHTCAQHILQELDEEKDDIEFACCKHALSHNKPILGICRGLHVLNVIFGGTLLCDVHEHNKEMVTHINYDDYDKHRHPLTIVRDTMLYELYAQTDISVTSYHHQGIDKLGVGLQVMAYSPDGLVEAVQYDEARFVVGIQFHPERMYDDYEGNKKVFLTFITNL